jgi:NitT/TauT family transport system substrate-binding protein
MSLRKTLLLYSAGWLILISGLHARLNPESIRGLEELAASFHHSKTAVTTGQFKIGFLPVTCHLTCPVTDFINQQTTGHGAFEPVRFNSWPELKESYLAGHTPATFILAPMAIALREQGVNIKIVYLGHRDGTAVMVHKDSSIYRMEDLRGKRVAIPNRYSNQRLLFFRALKQANMTINDITLVEMPPPDMPAALYSKSVDAVCSGEPFMGQTELDGYGRVLWLTKDVWPNFISCVLAVREDIIQTRRADVQALVDGIAKSGKWLDQSMDHRMSAAQFVSKNYYMQDPRLLAFVLSKPPDRVKYTRLEPLKPDFEEIEVLGKESGILKGTAHFEDYVDPSFATAAEAHAGTWDFQDPKP